MLEELRRGGDAFDKPAAGFAVAKLSQDDKAVNISSVVPADTCVVVAVRNLGSVNPSASIGHTLHDSKFISEDWTVVEASARPIPALGGRYAMPCHGTTEHVQEDINAVQYHHLWLHTKDGDDTVKIELLTCVRGRDDSDMYSNKRPGTAVFSSSEWRWQSGMMGWRELSPYDWKFHDWDLLRKAIWASSHRKDEDPGLVGKELILAPNQNTIDNPAAHWIALKIFGSQVSQKLPETPNDISSEFRTEWNACFIKFGSAWLMNPYPEMTLENCRDHCLLKARVNKWWTATDLAAILETQAAAKIQKACRACLSDPQFRICRQRLQHEFQEMEFQEMPLQGSYLQNVF